MENRSALWQNKVWSGGGWEASHRSWLVNDHKNEELLRQSEEAAFQRQAQRALRP
jgi:hypothetical protein